MVSAALYLSVTLTSADQCTTTLAMLVRRPDIARHVQELIVRPRSRKWLNRGFTDNMVASKAVLDVASRRLEALTTFAWDDEELPYHDDMWFALRVGCPQLRYVSTGFGSFLPSYNSHLFDLSDLYGFSLFLRNGFYDTHVGMFFDEDDPMWQKLWTMLIERCPKLEALTIDGVSALPTDAQRLVEGRWPRLQRLSLGDVVIDWTTPSPGDEQKRPFISFLEAHSSLKSLSLSRRNIDPQQLSLIDPETIPLTSFSGTFPQLQALSQFHSSLTSVSLFRQPLQTREVTAPAVASVLQGISQLTKLKISFMLHSMYDSGSLLRSLISSCPHLSHLELTCSHKPSFQLDAFSKTLRGFLKLRVLHLTIVKYPGGDSLSLGAERIAMSNPRLEKFSLTLLPPTYPLPLPFSLPFSPFSLRSRDTGHFTVTCDHHGLPITLRAFERKRLFWPLGFGSMTRTKRYISDLRPAGSPSRRKAGFRGMLSLLNDGSTAGEELRLLVFCSLLVSLALWGFLSGARGREP